MNNDSLNRFLSAQNEAYKTALSEIENGEKRSHWMWYIFPQLQGLGKSQMSYYYGICGLEEAKAYLEHPVLSSRLTEISGAVLKHKDKRASDIFGGIDSKKLRSCMTLFAFVSEDSSVFHRVLECFYNGKPDMRTLNLLKNNS